jgi:hypothetical protein
VPSADHDTRRATNAGEHDARRPPRSLAGLRWVPVHHGTHPEATGPAPVHARALAGAQETYIHTLESAEEQHGDGEAAHRIALSALKHSFEKVGDHWEPKEHKGPSDRQAAKSGAAARRGRSNTAGGVDAGATKAHLMDRARQLDVAGRSKMTKDQLVQAIDAANRKESARSRRR